MSREPFDESMLTAYLDDELSLDDRARVEAALRESPQLSQFLEELRLVRKLVCDAVRSEVSKQSGTGSTTPSFAVRGPWQSTPSPSTSVSVPQLTSVSPSAERSQSVELPVSATHVPALRPALRGWMMLASLAATIMLGLFVFSPWRNRGNIPLAAAPTMTGSNNKVDSARASSLESSELPRLKIAPADPAPMIPGPMPSASLPAPTSAGAQQRMPSPNGASAMASDGFGVNASSQDAPIPVTNQLGTVPEGLIQLLAEATPREDMNRSADDSLARSRKLQELETLEVKQSTDVDPSLPPREANVSETLVGRGSTDATRFVFILQSPSDSVVSSDKQGEEAARGNTPKGSINAPAGGVGGSGGFAPNVANAADSLPSASGERQARPGAAGGGFSGGTLEDRSLRRSSGNFAGGRAAPKSTTAAGGIEESGSTNDTLESGVSQKMKRNADAASNNSWTLAAFDPSKDGQNPSTQLIVEFRFPKNRKEQALEALRVLGVIVPMEIIENDASADWFVGEIDDSQKMLYERVESRIVEREKTDAEESRDLSLPPRTSRYLEPTQESWRSIRILLRPRASKLE